MLEYDFDMSVSYWICSTSHAIRKLLGAQLSQEKITLRQFEVLVTLANLPGCGSQTEIADALGIEPHTLAGVLKRMERDGLLARTSCDHDRRKNKVQPTPKAEEMWERATSISRAIRDEVTQGFSQEELTLLHDFCNRLQTNVATAEAALAPTMQPVNHISAPPHAAMPFSPTIHP